MKNLFFIAIAICISMSSCSKNNNGQLQKSSSQFLSNPTKQNGTYLVLGEDETIPIVILKPVGLNGNALMALVTLINGSDTVAGQTDVSGQCTLKLTHSGEWSLGITSQGYRSLNTTANFVDSVTVRVDTLQLQ
jgi:hypothetical protein